MKKGILFAVLLVAFAGFAVTRSLIDQPCGVIALGNYKFDLSSAASNTEIPKAMLPESIKSGLSFSGTEKCPGSFEIVGFTLKIEAEREAAYQYDYDFVRKMQSMEDYMLVRYFNDAMKLHFTQIKVKDNMGNIMDVPSVSFAVK